jgi:DNA-directed RNA polymerase specialized sigma subunit
MENTKKELNAYKHNKRLLEKMDEEIEEYRNKATSCTSVLSDMPKGTGIHDKVAQYASIIADIEAEKMEQRILLEKSRKDIEDIINKIEQPYRNILYFRYIKEETLEEIACDIGYNYRHLCRMHEKALLEFKRIKDVM